LRLGIVFFSNGVEPAHWWAKGSGATMELGPAALPMLPHREDMVFIRGLFNQSALRLDQPAPRAHEPALGRADQPRSERDPGRHVDGPGRRQRHRRQDRHPQPRPRRRAQRAAARGRAVDDLRLEPVVGHAEQAGDQGDLPVAAFDRLVGDGTGRALDRSILDAVRPNRPASSRASAATTTTS
jgi:hypothetical protein